VIGLIAFYVLYRYKPSVIWIVLGTGVAGIFWRLIAG